MRRLREWWADFWHGPLCAACDSRHHLDLPSLAICVCRTVERREARRFEKALWAAKHFRTTRTPEGK